VAALAASSPRLPSGRGLGVSGANRIAARIATSRIATARMDTSRMDTSRMETSPIATARMATSPTNVRDPAQDEIDDEAELTTPPTSTTPTVPQPVIDSTTRQQPSILQIKSSGSIEGPFGISEYWPVTNYWGADKTLGEFKEPLAGNPGWFMLGHKFQTVGRFESVCAESGTGRVTFVQEARITNTKGGTPGPWFDDMQYTDASGGVHHWDPNAEAGTTGNGPGVRRTVAADAYAYTDPPAISFGPHTNTYRKLDFRIHLKPPAGSPDHEIVKETTQEIEVVDGVPSVKQSP
jgi:hypothetical protein